MKKKTQALIIALAVVALIGGAGIFGYLVLNTFSYTGDAAVTQMNDEERQLLERIGRIHKTMNVAAVYAVLGEPTSEIFGLAKWDAFAGSRLSQLRIYFFDGQPRKIRWIKLGSFMYERDL
jgi:hypothetical protein